MENLKIEHSKRLPEINCSYSEGKIVINGRSLPENIHDAYVSFDTWVSEYLKQPQTETTIEFKVEYLNSSSNRYFYTLLKKFEDLTSDGKKVCVNWYYSDDEDIYSIGQDFKDFLTIDFNLIEQ